MSPLTVRPAAALLLAALALAPSPAPAAPKRTPPPDAPIYDPDLDGEKAIATYQKAAQDSGRRLLVNLGKNDCDACAVFNRAIHRANFWEPFNQQFLTVEVDVSNLPNAMLVDKYLVNPKAPYPAILIFLPDGRFLEGLVHGEMAALAKKGEDAVRGWLLSRYAKD